MPYKSKIHSEHSVQTALYKHVSSRNKGGKKRGGKLQYPLSSVYIYDWKNYKTNTGYRWESDFFFMDSASMCWEIEIKVDRLDFKRERFDGKKHKKHDLLQRIHESNNSDQFLVPNYFYYCAPTGMIDVEELQPYAGLIEVDDDHNLTFKSGTTLVHDYVDREGMNELLLSKFYKKSLKEEKVNIDFNLNTREMIKNIESFKKSIDKMDIDNNSKYFSEVDELIDKVREFHRKKRIA